MWESSRERVSRTDPLTFVQLSCLFRSVVVSEVAIHVLNADSLVVRSDVLMTTELPLMLIGRWLGEQPPLTLAVPMVFIAKCLPQLLHTTSLPDCLYPFGPQTSHVSKATWTLPSVPFTAKNLIAVPFES
jgi:hypothetical protein